MHVLSLMMSGECSMIYYATFFLDGHCCINKTDVGEYCRINVNKMSYTGELNKDRKRRYVSRSRNSSRCIKPRDHDK